jgi:hypothetical protein
MTDWIEHTTDTCPVDPETVVQVQIGDYMKPYGPGAAKWMPWESIVTHYRIITPAKPPEPEKPFAPWDSWPKRSSEVLPSEPDLITLRLECLKLAVTLEVSEVCDIIDTEKIADGFLDYVLNGSADKAP